MSVRTRALYCADPSCVTRVAEGQVTDEIHVWEISFHPSVTAAPALGNGMSLGNFNSAVVMHSDEDGKVTHVIVTSRQAEVMTRRRHQRDAGQAMTHRILLIMRQRVNILLYAYGSTLMLQQCEDINALAGLSQDASLGEFFDKVNSLSVEQLCTVLTIIGRDELPGY